MSRIVSTCEHLEAAPDTEPLTTEGCQSCLETDFRDWVHLRVCLTCGYVGCCDSSPYQHATAHYRDSQHPVMRSFQPGESWRWCYVDEQIG